MLSTYNVGTQSLTLELVSQAQTFTLSPLAGLPDTCSLRTKCLTGVAISMYVADMPANVLVEERQRDLLAARG